MKQLSYTQIARYFGPKHEGLASICDMVINKGMTFTEACDEENFYGYRKDVVEQRLRAALFLADLGYSHTYTN